jgi:sporulation protein YabP
MNEEQNRPAKLHNIILEGRTALSASGVEDVDSFDENTVSIFTGMGVLTIRGEQLHINRFSIESGELSLEGNIYSLSYSDDMGKKAGGFLSKVFR